MRLLASFAVAAALLGADADGTVLHRTSHRFGDYAKVNGIRFYATAEEYAAATGDQRYALERIVYASDGLKVVAFAYRLAAGGKRPTIVFNRGGFNNTDISLYAATFHRLAESGFAVIAPMLRGSEGGEGEDQLGGSDLHDLLSAAALAKNLEFADAGRLFLYGESRGGMMTYQAIRDHFPALAAAVVGAYTDQKAMLEAQPRMKPVVEKLWAKEGEAAFPRRSAIEWADRLTVPLLIQHGGADDAVNASQSLRLAARLQELHRPYQLIIWAGDTHVLTINQVERDRAVIRWFAAALK